MVNLVVVFVRRFNRWFDSFFPCYEKPVLGFPVVVFLSWLIFSVWVFMYHSYVLSSIPVPDYFDAFFGLLFFFVFLYSCLSFRLFVFSFVSFSFLAYVSVFFLYVPLFRFLFSLLGLL